MMSCDFAPNTLQPTGHQGVWAFQHELPAPQSGAFIMEQSIPLYEILGLVFGSASAKWMNSFCSITFAVCVFHLDI